MKKTIKLWESLSKKSLRNPFSVLAFGEVLWDILPTETVLGGAPCNFVYRVNSLGDRGMMVSRLGRDELGKAAFEALLSLDLDTTHVQWDDHHPTGTVPVTFDENSSPSFVIIPDVAYDYIETTDALRDAASTADCLCFGTLSQRSGQTRQTLRELLELADKSLKLLDINLRKDCYNLETVTYSLEKADVLKLNEDELYELAEMLDITDRDALRICKGVVKDWSLKYCVVTLGEKGAFGISKNGEKVYVPGYKIKLADSLGAGDAFTAGFAYCILRDQSLAEACEFGNVLGALVSTTRGATVPISQDEIDSFRHREMGHIHSPDFEQLADR